MVKVIIQNVNSRNVISPQNTEKKHYASDTVASYLLHGTEQIMKGDILKSQYFGDNQAKKPSEINDKQKNYDRLATVAAVAIPPTAAALKIVSGIKKYKTFKNYCKNMNLTDWNYLAFWTSLTTLCACLSPELFKKEANALFKKEGELSFREKIATGASAVLIASISVWFLGV